MPKNPISSFLATGPFEVLNTLKINCHNPRIISPIDFKFGPHIQCLKGLNWA